MDDLEVLVSQNMGLGSFLGPKQVIDELMRFSKLGNVYLWYIRKKWYLGMF